MTREKIIEELTNEMKALLYRYNSMTNREDKKILMMDQFIN